MDNPEPAFAAYGARLTAEPRYMRDRHAKLQLEQHGAQFAALGWHWAEKIRALALAPGEPVDVVYRLRDNEHPDFGGIELEIVDLRRSAS
jgi:single-stranded-DNA-specific exonuclease